ncbi:MAG: DNA mismatch repair protein MutS, partial [Gammaproteobacteria bacterium]|nr:DNA mismatch repair protein MutS [Gammaproteobacteria bacterium]
ENGRCCKLTLPQGNQTTEQGYGAQRYGLAWLELSSGRFHCQEIPNSDHLLAEVERLNPAEILLPDDLALDDLFKNRSGVKRQPVWHFDEDSAAPLLTTFFNSKSLQGYGCQDMLLAQTAAAALLLYVKDTQRTALPHITGLVTEQHGDAVILDAESRRNLEIEVSLSGHEQHTLAGIMDVCVTAMGSRCFRRWLKRPLRDQSRLNQRFQAIEQLLSRKSHLEFRQQLQGIADIERILTRIALKSARPRDLTSLNLALQRLPDLQQTLNTVDCHFTQALASDIATQPDIQTLLQRAIIEEPPLLIRDGGVIAKGFDAELDELRALSENADQFLIDLEQREREKTGINGLKVAYNRVHGFYIEISRLHLDNIPIEYVRRQTLKAVERFITPELKSFEDKVLSAKERALAKEKALYEQLLDTLIKDLPSLQTCADGLARLDAICCLAERAEALSLCQPQLTQTAGINITAGRHLVVEQVSDIPFVANDIALDGGTQMLIITGPNMGGKSTYMRQIALITLLAHIGSYVPAESATLGPIDRIFTRIGASDDLASGRSTFMVEMTEAANILNNATPQSLVLMDEVGRGTSTFDGLSLAWACAEHLAQFSQAFTLFATHYFELTRLDEKHKNIKNVHLDAVEHGNGIVFMHKVKDGPASQSYGLQVAKLAGIPSSVIIAARKKLFSLEQQALEAAQPNAQISLFAHQEELPSKESHPVVDDLKNMNPDELTPKAALELLYALKAEAEK